MPQFDSLRARPGVYMIRCLLDKRTYVGSSVNVRKRVQNHMSALSLGKHHSPHLQRAFSKYGAGYFEVFAVGYYDKSELKDQEQFWLDNASCTFNGSRLAYRVEHTEAVRRVMSEKCKAAWQRPGYRERMSSMNKGVPSKLKGTKASPAVVAKLQAAHRARHRTVEAFGKLWSLKELAEEYGVKYTMLKDRVRAGWTAEAAVLRQKRKGGL